VALNRVFRTAMLGESRERPELAQTTIPLEICVTPLPGGPETIKAFFEPLGWVVACTDLHERHGTPSLRRLDNSPSHYRFDVDLRAFIVAFRQH
jgi:hypothetical protein